MTAAPRFWHCGTNVFSSQARSVMTSVAGLPLILALVKSGYCVFEWLPQMVTLRDGLVGDAGLLGQGGDGAVVVEPRHGRPALGGDVAAVADRRPGSSCCTGCRRRGCARRLAAFAASALPWPTKILPFMPSRSLRSMPCLRGNAPTSRAQLHAVERLVRVVGDDDVLQRREAAVFQLHAPRLRGARAVGRAGFPAVAG